MGGIMRIGKTTALAAMIAFGAISLVGPAPIAAAAASPAARADVSAPAIIQEVASAGWLAPPGPSTVSATFKIPHISCTSANVGIAPGAYLNVGIGGGFSGAGVSEYCENGQLTDEAYSVINSTQTALFTVNLGDTMAVSISETLKGGTSEKVTDVTTGATASPTGAGGGPTGVFAGTLGIVINGSYLGVPTFTNVPFSAVRIGGKTLGSVKPAELERVSGKTVQLVPSAITGGTAFKVLFKHN
jgi:Peptidase A4 family